MRVWILCNESAGRSISDDDLRTLVENAGHTVVDLVSARNTKARPDPAQVDLVVSAGGDGTVAAGAEIVSATPIPLAILPLGTANNIATSLGLAGEMTDLIASWHDARHVPFDLGYARLGSTTRLIVEGAGCGLIPAGIAAAGRKQRSRDEAEAHPATEVIAAAQTFYDMLDDLEPVRQTVVIDGAALSEDLLLLEILNIRSVGPNIVLSADGSPSDGHFDVVFAGPAHRAGLKTYLEDLMSGQPSRLSLPTRRAQSVTMSGCAEVHFDDECMDLHRHDTVSIDISPGAIVVLV